MIIDCMDTPAKIIYVAPKGSVTGTSDEGTYWTEEVAHPATVHVIEQKTDRHVGCYSINGGVACRLAEVAVGPPAGS